jgi:putative DNA primase/helicase
MVAGYRDWREHGFGEPEQVILATAAYQAESDVLARFIADICLTGPHFRVRSNELFAAWSRWCG